jgi:hypothetical protein
MPETWPSFEWGSKVLGGRAQYCYRKRKNRAVPSERVETAFKLASKLASKIERTTGGGAFPPLPLGRYLFFMAWEVSLFTIALVCQLRSRRNHVNLAREPFRILFPVSVFWRRVAPCQSAGKLHRFKNPDGPHTNFHSRFIHGFYDFFINQSAYWFKTQKRSGH